MPARRMDSARTVWLRRNDPGAVIFMSTAEYDSMKDNIVRLDDELSVYYQLAGHGETVILLVPGWTMSSRVFEHQLTWFDQSDEFQFITFDPRSHGFEQ